MEILEILDKIEDIINNENLKQEENDIESENQPKKNTAKDLIYLALQFLLSILKAPFNIIAKYLKNEVISAIKKDAKLYALIIGIIGVLFVFFSVLWLFISIAVGTYFYENGHTLLMSIVYSITFQIICFIILGLIAFIASKNVQSLKMMKRLKDYKH